MISDDSTPESEGEVEEEEQEEETATTSTRKKSGRRKGKSKTRAAKAPKESIKEKIRCGSCNNLMTQSSKINWHEVKGKKIPKNAEGDYVYSSPEMAEGKVGTALCDDCLQRMEKNESFTRINTAVVERDGEYTNVPVASMPGTK